MNTMQIHTESLKTVSVVIPCFNEEKTIRKCIESTIRCSRNDLLLEILVVDGGSDDDTLEILSELQKKYTFIKVLRNQAKVTPIGLNIGIKQAKGDFILILGGHTTVSDNYIEVLVEDLENDSTVACAGGVCISVLSQENLFQRLNGALGESKFGVGGSCFRTGCATKRYVDTVAYGIYRREIFDEVGLFDERLVRNQDIELSHRIRRRGYNIILNPGTEAYYYPRTTLHELCKQSFSNGYWNIITWRLVPGSLSVRHFVPLGAVVCGLGLCVLSSMLASAKVVLAFLALLYLLLAIYASISIAAQKRDSRFLLTFLLFPIFHVSYGVGSLCSLIASSSCIKNHRT
jgi:glycosyltransferase involved in cell wall biosynthesis